MWDLPEKWFSILSQHKWQFKNSISPWYKCKMLTWKGYFPSHVYRNQADRPKIAYIRANQALVHIYSVYPMSAFSYSALSLAVKCMYVQLHTTTSLLSKWCSLSFFALHIPFHVVNPECSSLPRCLYFLFVCAHGPGQLKFKLLFYWI